MLKRWSFEESFSYDSEQRPTELTMHPVFCRQLWHDRAKRQFGNGLGIGANSAHDSFASSVEDVASSACGT
jgi:hypothetical protein